MNKKSKIITIASICSALAVALVVTLCCVFLIKHDPFKIDGNGSVSVVQNEDGTKTLTAKASKWHTFMGWYENVDDQEPTFTTEDIVLGEDASIYTAVFKTSPINSIDRLLSGIYYRYSDAIANEKDYFNFSGSIDLNLNTSSENFEELNYTIEAGGYFNFKGEGNQIYLIVKPTGTEFSMAAFYYVDNTMEGKIYVQVLGEKYTFNCESLTEVFSSIPELSENVWTFENVLKGLIGNDETFNMIYPTIEQIFGAQNSVAFWRDASNGENLSTFSFRIDKVIKYLNDNRGMLKPILPESLFNIFEKVLSGLTSEYAGLLPNINLEFGMNYNTVGDIEYLSDIDLGFSLPENYKINFGDVIEIPSSDLFLKINNLSLGFAEEANAINEDILKTFPEAINILNMHLAGDVNFVKQEGETETILDNYALELNADLNPFAVLPGIVDGKFDATKVKWDRLGFLSLKISLVENPEDAGQMERHGGVKDYINLLIDTEKYGPKAMLFVGLYNPNISAKVLGTNLPILKNEIINASIDLREFVNYLTATPVTTKESNIVAKKQMSANLISDVTEDVVTDNVHIENLIYEVLLKLLGDTSDFPILDSDLSYDANSETITIALNNIKTKLKELLGTDIIDLNSNIFGTDSSHISLGLKNFEYGKVKRGDAGEENLADYVDKAGKSFVESYNEEHITLKSVEGLYINSSDKLKDKVYSKENFINEIKQQLDGQKIFAEKGIMSDNSEVTTFPNSYAGAGKGNSKIEFRLLDVKVINQNETSAEVEYSLRLTIENYYLILFKGIIANKVPSIKGCNGIYDIIFKLANIPFVYTVTETVNLA